MLNEWKQAKVTREAESFIRLKEKRLIVLIISLFIKGEEVLVMFFDEIDIIGDEPEEDNPDGG